MAATRQDSRLRGNDGSCGKQSGYLLLPVAIAIALIGVIAFLISSESAIETSLAERELETSRARYVAQAGLQHALRNHAQQGCGPYTDLTKVAFGSDQYETSLTHDLKATASYSALTDQDTWIRSDFPTNNYAADTSLHVRSEGGVTERPLYRYDLSAIPAKAAVLSAKAHFYVVKGHPEGPVDIHLVTGDWTEADTTWDSMNDEIDPGVLATIPAQPTAGVWVSVNLTAQVQAWINGADNYGITLNSTSEGVHAEYGSRESATESWLEIGVGDPPTSPAKLKSTGSLASGGAASLKRDDVVLRQSPASHVVWQHDAALGVDAYIWEWTPNTNYGVDDEVWVAYSNNNTARSLFKFAVERLPAGARILNATLSLEHESGNGSDVPITAHRITRDWDEGEVTWNLREAGTNWDTAGGDFDAAIYSTTEVGPTSGVRYEWDLTGLVQGWVDGTFANQGVALATTMSNSIGERFFSSDETVATRRPRLTINYSCQCGSACITLQGSGNILMAVVSPTVLVDEDQQAKDLFESWGYTVNVISESANQSTYDAGVAANDVVFISETVNSNSVGTKLQGASIGVVSQDGDYNADLGLASGSGYAVDTAIEITDNSHYIARPFAMGPLAVYRHAMEQLTVSGSLGADQQPLADSGGLASLVALEAGAAMEGGGNAAGRRVMLPLGTRYRFDWNYLNANGRLLVQRAIEWGMGNDLPPAAGLLLVVTNPSSPTAQEQAKQALIESWGYTVNLIDDGASATDFNAAFDANNLVYVSGEVSETAIGNKLTDAAIAIVNEQSALHDELLLSTGAATNDFNNIMVIDNTHYITQGIPTGWHGIASTNQPLNALTGTLAPGLTNLAEVWISGANYDFGLAVVDTGGQLNGGQTAAGRRVQLPWGTAGFDFSALNGNGRNLMRRAIEWGLGITAPPLTQELLFVVPSPGSLGATDTVKQTLFESWGYTVNQIDDDAPLADFVAATAANTVVYVAATAVAASVGSKLFKAPIGVVNANSGLHDDFGFSTVRYISSTNAPLNTVASHYITQPFAGGQVTLYTSDQTSGGAVGTLAADLDQIGTWGSGAISPLGGLVTLDAGAMTSIGENTPARRAQMPWDNLDVTTLSDDGLTILQRSLEWAEGANIDLSPLAHWKLDETTGPTAVDSEGGHDGTWTNGPTPTPGLIDGGLDFDGGNDHIVVPHDDNLSLTNFTLYAWINPSALSGWQVILNKGTTTSAVNYYLATNGDEIGLGFYNAGWVEFNTTNANLVVDDWYQVVATYDDANREGRIYLDGELIHTSTVSSSPLPNSDNLTIGRSGFGEYWPGTLDDVRIYDRVLGADEISDLYAESAPPEPGYYELHQPWSANNDDTWETVDLAPFGVPGDAVVEVAILNADNGKEQWAGVRAVGSTLERRFLLHEPEAGGVDALTLHVQADASGRIQHYTSKKGETSFLLLGYWIGAEYVELFGSFTASDDGEWRNANLGSFGVGPNQVAELVLQNTDTGAERLAGVRAVGSSINRRFDLHEAESGGVDAVSMMVQTDASSRVQVYAEVVADIDYAVVGYWSTPPGSFTELGGTSARSTPSAAWGLKNIASLAVPANSVTQFVVTNDTLNAEKTAGVRAVGSSSNRFVDLQEAEAGGSDLVTMHANVDANTEVEWYSESGTSGVFFYPVGAWIVAP